jgi:hypothetical protein
MGKRKEQRICNQGSVSTSDTPIVSVNYITDICKSIYQICKGHITVSDDVSMKD